MQKKILTTILLLTMVASCSTIDKVDRTTSEFSQLDRMPSNDVNDNICLDMVRAIMSNDPKNNLDDLSPEVLVKRIIANPALIKELVKSEAGREAVIKNAMEAQLRNTQQLFNSVKKSKTGVSADYKEYVTDFVSLDLKSGLKDSYLELSSVSPDLFIFDALYAASDKEREELIKVLAKYIDQIESINVDIANWSLMRPEGAKYHIGDQSFNTLIQSLFGTMVNKGLSKDDSTAGLVAQFLGDVFLKSDWSVSLNEGKSIKIAFENQFKPYFDKYYFDMDEAHTAMNDIISTIVEDVKMKFSGPIRLSYMFDLPVKETRVSFPGGITIEGTMGSVPLGNDNRPLLFNYLGSVSFREKKFSSTNPESKIYKDIAEKKFNKTNSFPVILGEYTLNANGKSIKSSAIDSKILKELKDKKSEVHIVFKTKIELRGKIFDIHNHSESNQPILITFDECTITGNNMPLYQKEWGLYDFILNPEVSDLKFK